MRSDQSSCMALRATIVAAICGPIICAAAVTSPRPVSARTIRVQPAPTESDSRLIWFRVVEGWQVRAWGAGRAYRWRVERSGRGMIALPASGERRDGQLVEYEFRLTPPQLNRFAVLINRFRTQRRNEGPCMTDQAQDVMIWNGGGPGRLAGFDHGCRAAADQAHYQSMVDALAILRAAAGRE